MRANNADELAFINIDSISASDAKLIEVIKEVAKEIFTPITIGGGIDEMQQIQNLLNAGADKVMIGHAALQQPHFIKEAVHSFGSQCILISIDYKMINGNPHVFTKRGAIQAQISFYDWVKECEQLGAGEIVITSIDKDGSHNGLDIKTLETITSTVNIPVIGSGGCGNASHFVEGFANANLDAVAAGSYFCLQDQNPMQCRAHVKNANIPIRTNI